MLLIIAINTRFYSGVLMHPDSCANVCREIAVNIAHKLQIILAASNANDWKQDLDALKIT